jgi:hypothetical protein
MFLKRKEMQKAIVAKKIEMVNAVCHECIVGPIL